MELGHLSKDVYGEYEKAEHVNRIVSCMEFIVGDILLKVFR